MRVRELPLSESVIEHFEAGGVETLYPPQEAAVEAGICDGSRLVAAIPTASGKTFIAELAMLGADGPALYIVPLRALAREKYETFADLPDVSVGISTGDFDSTGEELADNDIIVATSEKVDSALRNGADWVEDLACVVVDEVHLLGAEGRGPTLEVTLANLDRRAPAVQIVALSATVDNPEDIADWLGAELIESDWRPIDLRTGVSDGERVRFDDGSVPEISSGSNGRGGDAASTHRDETGSAQAETDTRKTETEAATSTGSIVEAVDDSTDDPPDSTETAVALVTEAVDDGGQCLAFVSSRSEAEQLADRLSRAGLGRAPDVAADIEALDATGMGRRLTDCVRDGVAFHHAGLTNDHRAAVEAAFRERTLAVICATPTLAAGVNVPARRVVVRDQQRYTGSGTEWLPVLEVHQMCGRAGRPHLDPYGEAVLVSGDHDPDELWARYVEADPEAVESKLADPEALRTHVLSIVAAGFADTRAGVLDVLDATFYAHQTPESDLDDIVDTVIEDLASMEMVDVEGTGADLSLTATTLGETVSRQYVTPDTGAKIVEGIRATTKVADVTELTALEIVCDTPDMQDTYLGNRERADMYQFARRHAAEFTTDMAGADDFEGWLESVKTARILAEWADGADAADIVDQFRVGPGDLESRIERAEWLLGAADAIAEIEGIDIPAFRTVRDRL